MTVKQRIFTYLQNHPEGIDDDDLARVLSLSTRQQANMCCRELERDGLVIRRHINGKIHNFWAGKDISSKLVVPSERPCGQDVIPKSDNWFWEGNIQAMIITYLAAQGYLIRSATDTASHQQGIDIVAEKDRNQLWVSVKGYPQDTEKTHASVQAGHWFKEAIFDILEYREKDKDVLLAVALPDYPRYHSMAQKITWLKLDAKFSYYWVKENGEISVD